MINLTNDEFLDLKNMFSGVLAPLNSFMGSDDFKSVAHDLRLKNGEVFTIPITLATELAKINCGEIKSLYFNGEKIGEIKISDIFTIEKADFYAVFNTNDLAHPGLKKELTRPAKRIGGNIQISDKLLKDIRANSLYKGVLRDIFSSDIKTICGFQTRNPIHRAHEHLQRVALELCDALFINPIIGWKKPGDFTNEAVFAAYKTQISEFYPKHRVAIRGLETAMRYAGPKEAIFHAILRKNMGCTHFIIGRDHAGVGDFYSKYAAHDLAKELKGELGIELLLLYEPYFCKKCQQIVTKKHCDHYGERIAISATQIRKELAANKEPDTDMMRKEIADAILALGRENIFIKE